MENDSKTMSADNWGQIIRKDARGCFVEIKNDCFHLEKVHLQFVSYDTSLPKGSRYTSNINIYIDVPEFLALTQEAASGTLHMRMQQYKQEKKQSRYMNIWAAPRQNSWPSTANLGQTGRACPGS